MCRSAVAIMRGGNFWGAAWHRPQFARKRLSPSMRIESTSAVTTTAEASADFLAELDPAQRGRVRTMAPSIPSREHGKVVFTAPPLQLPSDRAESENGRRAQSSTD